MNKGTIAITDFKKKPYATPQISVVEIKEADVICTSGGSTEDLEPTTFPWGA